MKSPIIDTLRINAKAAPLWADIMNAAADELERLKSIDLKYENLMKNGLICPYCGGAGSVGNPPYDYQDCPECERQLNRVEAEAVREAVKVCEKKYYNWNEPDSFCKSYKLLDYDNKIERGEV